MPALPKPAALRQRRNKKAGATELVESRRRAPVLPNDLGREWHRLTRAWWAKVWRSPMANEYLDTDVDGLVRLAVVVDQFYETLDPKLMAEIRLQEARFGLSPVDRSRLQWEVAKGEEAARRHQIPSRSQPANESDDPRSVLRAVK